MQTGYADTQKILSLFQVYFDKVASYTKRSMGYKNNLHQVAR